MQITLRALIGASVVSLAAMAGQQTPAAGVCIKEEAKAALNACSNSGPAQFNAAAHGKPHVNFNSAPPVGALNKKDGAVKPPNPSENMSIDSRDERLTRLKQRQKALLTSEIGGLENLFKNTAKNASDRVSLARRLAEDYVELETVATREKTQAEIDRDGLKKTNMKAAGEKQAQANQAKALAEAARKNAQKYYSIIKDEYPNYSALDEVLYYLAYEYEQAGNNNDARAVYFELIKKTPNSKYIPNAYLAFGELFFNEAQGDPTKWPYAEEAYKKVIGFPPDKSKVYGYAWYKLGYVFWNKGEYTDALNSFKKVIDWASAYSQMPGSSKLADAARKDTIPVYALKGDPTRAYDYFHVISGDAAGSNEKTFQMLDDLGLNYLDTGHYPEAITLYKELMTRDRAGHKHCVYQAHVTNATMAMKSSNKEAIKVELDNQLKNYSAFKAASHPAEAVQECANKTAELISETAMAWHLEAVGSGNNRGTGDQKTMTLAAYFYKKATDTWDAKTFSTFQFPRIQKEDWPSIYKIRYAMADLLYAQQRWAECGPAFDAVVAEDPNAPEAAESAYAAVLCYQNVYDQAHQGGKAFQGSGNLPGQGKKSEAQKKAEEEARLQPKAMTESQKGMISAFNKYICYIHPPANDAEGQEKLVEVKYARARTYFEAQHWEEAATLFRDIAYTHPDRDVGIYAAQLYLESINVLGSHSNPPRPTCFDDMAGDVTKFQELYCQGEKGKKNAEQCTMLAKIQCDIQRLKAENLVKLADKGATNATQLYEQAANTYYKELWEKYGKAQLDANQPAQCERLDEILSNSARAYQSARLIASAIRARTTLINYKEKLNNSPLADKAVYEIGGNYQAIASYEKAADYYEQYAGVGNKKTGKRPENADTALSDAVLLRLGLGAEHEAKALQDAKAFQDLFGGSKPQKAAEIAFAIGAHYAEKEDWVSAAKAIKGSERILAKANIDVQAQAFATLGRSNSKLKGKAGEAAAAFARVRKLWDDPAAAQKKLADEYKTEDGDTRNRRLAKILNSVGEAIFYFADDMKSDTVDKIKFPEYKGAGSKDEVMKHINTKVAEWMQKKVPAIERVEAEFKKIVNLQPDAPPKWVIAAGSRVGLLWGDFVDDFRKAPIPEAWKKDDQIRGIYFDALDAKSEPLKSGRAKPALKTCLDYSVKYQFFDEYSRSCEVWLAKNYKAEYHVVDELRGAPTLSNSGLDERPPPIMVGGTIYHSREPEVEQKKDVPAKGGK